MFGCEAAVKHTLLKSERPKYLGTDDGMINMELITKLYMVIAHNLNEARKARDGNGKNKTTKEPEKLKIGDNVLIRNHTSKAFQPKYKDFCIIGLLGKIQIEIKDNHGHITKVHRRDVKKIPLTEKVCQLYEEEQVGKIREGRKAVPNGKMPDLGWDITETQLQKDSKPEEIQELTENNIPQTAAPLQNIIAIAILIITVLEHFKSCIQKIQKLAGNTAQAVKSMISRISHNNQVQNFKKYYQTAALVITIATNMMNRINRGHQYETPQRNAKNNTYSRKPYDEYDGPYQSYPAKSIFDNYD